VYKYGGDEQPEAKITRPPEEEDNDEGEGEEEDDDDGEEGKSHKPNGKAKEEHVHIKAEPSDGPIQAESSKRGDSASPVKNGKGKEKADPALEFEDEEELEVKLALLDIYFSKLDKRDEAKDIIFDRCLTDFKKVSMVALCCVSARSLTHRSKRMRGKGRKTKESWFNGTRCLQSFKRLKTSRSSSMA
jgi:transcriptional adapter 2-alpha